MWNEKRWAERGATAAGFSCVTEESGSMLLALTVAAFDGCEKTSPCPCVDTWFWKNSATGVVLNGKQPCRVRGWETYTQFALLSGRWGDNSNCVYRNSWVNSIHGSVTSQQLCNILHSPDGRSITCKCNSMNVSWAFCVSAFRGLKVFWRQIDKNFLLISDVKLAFLITCRKLLEWTYW